MREFMDENYLLETDTAQKLFFEYARDMPIFDYHCHLSVQEIAEDRRFANITQLWLSGDHYKWRALRANGVAEAYITGNKSDKEKFVKWAETVPYTLGNPLFQWTYLELRKYFGITDYLNPATAEDIWTSCNKMLQQEGFSARGFIKKSNVKALCTTDDAIDSLEFHKQIMADTSFEVKVLPAFRPDMAVEIGHEAFATWVAKLGNAAGIAVKSFDDYKAALQNRISYFDAAGCRLSDHSLSSSFYVKTNEDELSGIWAKGLHDQTLLSEEKLKFRAGILQFLGREYAKKGWAMQLHIGAMRNTNSRMLRSIGINTGFDSIAEFNFAEELAKFMDELDSVDLLPKTILYGLNPKDNYLLAAMTGNFQSDIPGKIQFGSAWWFNDHEDGMKDQLKALANVGLISRFVGMLTDSRSFLSYTRHEYFRRIVCNLIGTWVERGDYYRDMAFLGKTVQDICFNNISNYLETEL